MYGSLVINEDKYYILLDVLDNIKRDDYAVYMIEVRAETVGQYTGLKDKIIDELIIYIDNLDIDEDICKHNKESLCKGKSEVSLDICYNCIKQYFEKKGDVE